MIELDESEKLVINEFINEHWELFCSFAKNYLSVEEFDSLCEKLSG